MRIVDQNLLNEVTGLAIAAERRRKNRNFHISDESGCHRLLNAIEPESYIAPHRHLDPGKEESIVVVRGRLKCIRFDENGNPLEVLEMQPGGAVVAVDLAVGEFHSLVSLASGTIFFEAKAGPYRPLQPGERASWAPPEGSPEAAGYLAWMDRLPLTVMTAVSGGGS